MKFENDKLPFGQIQSYQQNSDHSWIEENCNRKRNLNERVMPGPALIEEYNHVDESYTT